MNPKELDCLLYEKKSFHYDLKESHVWVIVNPSHFLGWSLAHNGYSKLFTEVLEPGCETGITHFTKTLSAFFLTFKLTIYISIQIIRISSFSTLA